MNLATSCSGYPVCVWCCAAWSAVHGSGGRGDRVPAGGSCAVQQHREGGCEQGRSDSDQADLPAGHAARDDDVDCRRQMLRHDGGPAAATAGTLMANAGVPAPAAACSTVSPASTLAANYGLRAPERWTSTNSRIPGDIGAITLHAGPGIPSADFARLVGRPGRFCLTVWVSLITSLHRPAGPC